MTLTGNAAAITLTNENNFLGTVGATNSGTGNGISITNAVGLTLGAVTSAGAVNEVNTTGNLSLTGVITGIATSLTSGTGSIAESGGSVVGTLATSSGGAQTLNGANNLTSFTATNSATGDISLTNTNALNIGAAGISQGFGNLSITNSGGAITQTGTITVSGATTIAAGANAITLAGNNALTGAVALSNSGAGNVSLNNTLALSLGNVNVGNGYADLEWRGDYASCQHCSYTNGFRGFGQLPG